MARTFPDPPPRIARLHRAREGYPIPWFVATIDGQPDFRIADTDKFRDAIRFRCCWLCGCALGSHLAYVIGPMCAVNRVSSEPPAHRDCAHYAAQACPFLTTPGMRRRPDLPSDTVQPDGHMITRNPGVVLLWVTRQWRMIPGHRLFDVGEPSETLWLREGRPATRDEVVNAIDTGMPLLRDAAQSEPDPQRALDRLDDQYARALKLAPA